jgi:hypothetical protein
VLQSTVPSMCASLFTSLYMIHCVQELERVLGEYISAGRDAPVDVVAMQVRPWPRADRVSSMHAAMPCQLLCQSDL